MDDLNLNKAPPIGIKLGVSAKSAAKFEEQRRQQNEEFTGMFRIWEEDSKLYGGLVFVGFGTWWHTFSCDAELIFEEKLCQSDHFYLGNVRVPMAKLTMFTGAWVPTLRLSGHSVTFGDLKYSQGVIVRSK